MDISRGASGRILKGTQFPVGPMSFSKTDIMDFARQHDPYPFHLDEEIARASILGGLAASGWQTTTHVLSILTGAMTEDFAALRSLGIRDLKWLRPVLVGDVLTGAGTVVACGPPDGDQLEIEVILTNQDGHLVFSALFPFTTQGDTA